MFLHGGGRAVRVSRYESLIYGDMLKLRLPDVLFVHWRAVARAGPCVRVDRADDRTPKPVSRTPKDNVVKSRVRFLVACRDRNLRLKLLKTLASSSRTVGVMRRAAARII